MEEDRFEDRARKSMIEILPAAFRQAMESYKFYIQKKESITDNKTNFSDYHMGCKKALSHLQLLIKMGEWLGEEGKEKSADGTLADAMAEVNAFLAEEVPCVEDEI